MSMERSYDLAVVGGGPAGTAAAITAARGGARVLLLERGRFPRHKVCGEFVSAESLGLLRTLLGREEGRIATALPIRRTRIFLGGRVLQAELAAPAVSIARFNLDEALWNSAAQAGVDARQNVSVKSWQGTGPFRIATTDGDWKAGAVLNASGRWSNLNANHDPPGQKYLGLKGHFVEPCSSDSVDLYFFAGGYCGVSPVSVADDDVPGRINACAMVEAGVATTLEEVVRRNAQLQERSRQWRSLTEPLTTWPLVFRKPVPAQGNTLRAGDAGGFIDPFVGDGISLALRSGEMAAQMMIPFWRGELTLETAVENYARSYAKNFGSIFQSSGRIRRALRLPEWVQAPVLSLMERFPGAMQHLVSITR